jgi:hypothetical protein
MLKYEPFDLSAEASLLIRDATQSLTGKRKYKPDRDFFVYTWTPELDRTAGQVIKDLVRKAYIAATR